MINEIRVKLYERFDINGSIYYDLYKNGQYQDSFIDYKEAIEEEKRLKEFR